MTRQSIEIAERLFNDPNRVPIGEFSKNLFRLIREVQQTRQRKFITINGKAVVAICPLVDVANFEITKEQI